MSNFEAMTVHPETGEVEVAFWMDDHFGRHIYGVRFGDGKIFHEGDIAMGDSEKEQGSDCHYSAFFLVESQIRDERARG